MYQHQTKQKPSSDSKLHQQIHKTYINCMTTAAAANSHRAALHLESEKLVRHFIVHEL